MTKTEQALFILLEQVKQGKYRVENGKLFNSKKQELGRFKENGYVAYCVRESGFKAYVYAHRFMYLYYYGNLESSMTINHIDGNKQNNTKDNLEQITRSDNTKHSFENGLQSSKGSDNNFSKLKEVDVKEIKKLLRDGGLTQKEIGKMFDVTQASISLINKGGSWGHVL